MKKTTKLIFIFLSTIIMLNYVSCSIGLEDKKQAAYDEGYVIGFEKGKLKAENDYTELLKREKADFENELKIKQAEYEKIVSESYNASYEEGHKLMQKDMDEIIDVSNGKKRKKRKSDKWNTEVK